MHQFANSPKGSATSHRGLWGNSSLLSRRLDRTARVEEAEQRPLRHSMLANRHGRMAGRPPRLKLLTEVRWRTDLEGIPQLVF